jgi:hypothetical protein
LPLLRLIRATANGRLFPWRSGWEEWLGTIVRELIVLLAAARKA